MDWIRLIFSALFVIAGLCFLCFAMFGVFKYKYVLNRMQVAAMGDTLGVSLCMIGLIIFSGFTFASLKLLLVILFLWVAGPVSSHLISRLEVKTNKKIFEDCEVDGE